jgi:hypothetical protein
LTLREERRLRVFEKRVLRTIYGTERDEMRECWRKLLDEELHNLHTWPSIILCKVLMHLVLMARFVA